MGKSGVAGAEAVEQQDHAEVPQGAERRGMRARAVVIAEEDALRHLDHDPAGRDPAGREARFQPVEEVGMGQQLRRGIEAQEHVAPDLVAQVRLGGQRRLHGGEVDLRNEPEAAGQLRHLARPRIPPDPGPAHQGLEPADPARAHAHGRPVQEFVPVLGDPAAQRVGEAPLGHVVAVHLGIVEPDRPAPRPFRRVERHVGAAEQILGLQIAALGQRAADGDGHGHDAAVEGDRLGQSFADPFRHRAQERGIADPRADQDEFVAAQPGHEIAGSRDGLQHPRDVAERGIAGRMADGIVDLLEAVDVEMQHAERRQARHQRRLRHPQELAPVGETGQRIGPRRLFDPFVGGAQFPRLVHLFGRVAADEQRPLPPAAVGDEGGRDLDPELMAIAVDVAMHGHRAVVGGRVAEGGDVLGRRAQIDGQGEVERVAPEHRGPAALGQPTVGVVDPEHLARRVQHQHPVRGPVPHEACVILAGIASSQLEYDHDDENAQQREGDRRHPDVNSGKTGLEHSMPQWRGRQSDTQTWSES